MDQSFEHIPQPGLDVIVANARRLLSFEESDQYSDQPFRLLGSGDNVSVYSLGYGIAARLYDDHLRAVHDKTKYVSLGVDGFPVPNVYDDVISGAQLYVLCVDEIHTKDWSRLAIPKRVRAYEQLIGILRLAIEKGWEPAEINIGDNTVWDADRDEIVVLDVEHWQRFQEEPRWISLLAEHLDRLKTDLEEQMNS